MASATIEAMPSSPGSRSTLRLRELFAAIRAILIDNRQSFNLQTRSTNARDPRRKYSTIGAENKCRMLLTIASSPGQPHASAARPAPVYGGGWEPEGNCHLGANPSQIHLSRHDTLIRSSRPIVIASLMFTADPESHYSLGELITSILASHSHHLSYFTSFWLRAKVLKSQDGRV